MKERDYESSLPVRLMTFNLFSHLTSKRLKKKKGGYYGYTLCRRIKCGKNKFLELALTTDLISIQNPFKKTLNGSRRAQIITAFHYHFGCNRHDIVFSATQTWWKTSISLTCTWNKGVCETHTMHVFHTRRYSRLMTGRETLECRWGLAVWDASERHPPNKSPRGAISRAVTPALPGPLIQTGTECAMRGEGALVSMAAPH